MIDSTIKPLVSVCIASVRADTLPFFVESILDQPFKEWELIVAIQGNEPTLIRYMTQQSQIDSRISFIHLTRYGKCYALNEAVKKARADILAFTDDDCTVASDWLSTIYHCFQEDSSVGIVAGDTIAPRAKPFPISICPATYTMEYIYRPSNENNFSAPEGFYWGGGNFAVRRPVLNLVGQFDEHMGPGTDFPAAEDVDFALRAEILGVVVWTTPKSIVYHTYGRRYGLASLLKYYQSSGIGIGALRAKLYLSNHRLFKDWKQKWQPSNFLVRFVKSPARAVVDVYKEIYVLRGCKLYRSRYTLDTRWLSQPLHENSKDQKTDRENRFEKSTISGEIIEKAE